MIQKFALNKQNQKDLTDYCKLNNIEDIIDGKEKLLNF